MFASVKPARAVSPGEVLSVELEARGWTQKDLADIMSRPYQAINEIIKGTKQITPHTAIELAEAFGTSSEFWLNLESNYRLALAEKTKQDKRILRKSRLYSIVPLRQLIKRRWIKASRQIEDLEQEVCRFLEIKSLDQTPHFAGVNFRVSEARGPEALCQYAWIARVRELAFRQKVSRFSLRALKNAVDDLLTLSEKAEDVAAVPYRLLESGVRFVIVPHLPKSYLDGATWMTGNNPLIALTLRYDRIDSFWFTLLHELAHILLKHSGAHFDNLYDGASGGKKAHEDQANQHASRWLVEPEALSEFVSQDSLYYSRGSVEQCAHQLGRHPGIIVGQMHHAGLLDYSYLRNYLVPVRSYLREWIDRPGPKQVVVGT